MLLCPCRYVASVNQALVISPTSVPSFLGTLVIDFLLVVLSSQSHTRRLNNLLSVFSKFHFHSYPVPLYVPFQPYLLIFSMSLQSHVCLFLVYTSIISTSLFQHTIITLSLKEQFPVQGWTQQITLPTVFIAGVLHSLSIIMPLSNLSSCKATGLALLIQCISLCQIIKSSKSSILSPPDYGTYNSTTFPFPCFGISFLQPNYINKICLFAQPDSFLCLSWCAMVTGSFDTWIKYSNYYGHPVSGHLHCNIWIYSVYLVSLLSIMCQQH